MAATDKVWATTNALTLGRLNEPQSRKAGSASALRVAFNGQLYTVSTDAGCSGTGETTVMTHAIAAGVLDTDGHGIEGLFGFRFANNGATKRIKLKWGSTPVTIFDSTAQVWTNTTGMLQFLFRRVSSSSIEGVATLWIHNSTPFINRITDATISMASSADLVMTLQGSTGSNDVVLNSGYTRWLPKAN